MTILDVEKLIAETNMELKHQQQIHPDDPIIVSVILHNKIIQAQIDAVQKKQEETINKLAAISEQHVDRSEAVAERLISKSGNKIEKQVDAAAQRGEERLRKATSETESTIRKAALFAWGGGILIAIWACITIGSSLGNVAFHLLHHSK